MTWFKRVKHLNFAVKTFTGSKEFKTNGYLIADTDAKIALAVDAPFGTASRMIRYAKKRGWRIKALMITHRHFDHMADADSFKAQGVHVLVHREDAHGLRNPRGVPTAFEPPFEVKPVAPDRSVRPPYVIHVGRLQMRVLHLPGHTEGSAALHEQRHGLFFTGDILMKGGVGRTDFEGGNPQSMRESLIYIANMDPGTRVFPGHGGRTKISLEKPMLRELTR